MQQQYQLSFSMPLAAQPKQQPQDQPKLPDDLANLPTVSKLGTFALVIWQLLWVICLFVVRCDSNEVSEFTAFIS